MASMAGLAKTLQSGTLLERKKLQSSKYPQLTSWWIKNSTFSPTTYLQLTHVIHLDGLSECECGTVRSNNRSLFWVVNWKWKWPTHGLFNGKTFPLGNNTCAIIRPITSLQEKNSFLNTSTPMSTEISPNKNFDLSRCQLTDYSK